jgi:HPt (histidine-containing phosphotransfer) domain-containing protein
VHALKSASRQIGAAALAEQAAEMEKAGNEKNLEAIREITPGMLRKYRSYLPVMKPFFEEKGEEKELVSGNILQDFLAEMKDAGENLDIDAMESVLEKMKKYRYADAAQEMLFERLENAVEEIDTDVCEEIANEWLTLL